MTGLHLRFLKIAISLVAVLALVARLIWPRLRLDAVSLGLLIVAMVPWVAALFESLEFPGGWKISFRDLAKAAAAIPETTTATPSSDHANQPSYLAVQGLAPELAMVGLRIEMEQRLQVLAELYEIPNTGRPKSVRALTRELSKIGVIPDQVRFALEELASAANAAAHGATLPPGQKDFAFTEGPRFLDWLDELIQAARD